MRRILLIVFKDMKRRLRSPVSVICMLLIPIMLTLVVGLVFGRSGEMKLPRIKVLLVDNDGGVFSNFFKQGMRQGKLADLIDLVEVAAPEGLTLMGKGKASALIEIPKGFSSLVLDRKPAEIRLIKNPRESFLPLIVEEITGTMAVMIDGTVRVFDVPIERVRAMLENKQWPSGDELTELLESARTRIALVKPYLTDSLVSLKEETVSTPGEQPRKKFNFFALIMPGSIFIGILFIGEITMGDFLREYHAGTLSRTLAGPIGAGEVIAGKMLSAFAITFVASVLLIVIGRIGFGFSWGKPAPLFLHLVGSIFMCVGIMAFLYGFIKSERVASALLPVVIIVVCIVGGAMVPYEIMGKTMQRFAPLSPAFWVIDGLKRIALDGAGFRALGAHFAITYGVGAVTALCGAALLGRRVRRKG